jgi:hypothetical protein
LPDDLYQYFVDGFMAQCYRRSADPKIRAKFSQEWSLWLRSLDMAVKTFDKEQDDFGFTPSSAGVMDMGCGTGWFGPAWPFAGAPWGGY